MADSVRERPILFSAPMVRALLAGTKSQTRRVVKPQPPAGTDSVIRPFADERRQWAADDPHDIEQGRLLLGEVPRCPYGAPGEKLWVREAFAVIPDTGSHEWDSGRYYPADDTALYGKFCPATDRDRAAKRRPSIHMPRWASRITLEVPGVRVERLQDISEADAMAEGIVATHGGFGLPDGSHYHAADPRQSYFSLFEAINGPGSVEANPWLWVVSFPPVSGSNKEG